MQADENVITIACRTKRRKLDLKNDLLGEKSNDGDKS